MDSVGDRAALLIIELRKYTHQMHQYILDTIRSIYVADSISRHLYTVCCNAGSMIVQKGGEEKAPHLPTLQEDTGCCGLVTKAVQIMDSADELKNRKKKNRSGLHQNKLFAVFSSPC